MNEMLHSLSFASASAAGALFSAIWEGAVLALACLSVPAPAAGIERRGPLRGLAECIHSAGFAAFCSGVCRALRRSGRWPHAGGSSRSCAGAWRGGRVAGAVAGAGRCNWSSGAVHLRRLARTRGAGRGRCRLAGAAGGWARRPGAQLCTSDEVARPSVLGFFRPRILVPPALLEALTPQELQQVVLHEMEHLRRGDDWTNLLQKIGLVLFPLNPVLVWVERRLCAERELACDDRVMQSAAGARRTRFA